MRSEAKRQRFSKLFPSRAGSVMNALRILTNCSDPSGYEWNDDVVKRTWIEMAKHFAMAAARFDLDLVIRVNGKNVLDVDTSKPLKPARKRKQLKIPGT